MIGVFDSGVGGLTVVKEIFKYFPQEKVFYFGDTLHLPYGTKSEKTIKNYSEKIVSWFQKENINLIIIACNTASSWAEEYLKNKFKDIYIFGMIEPTVKEVARIYKDKKIKKIGVIGTSGTIKSRVYEKKLLEINKNFKIYSKSCPLFVSLIEEGLIKDKITKEVALKYLKPLKEKNIDALILGCTHYPLIKDLIYEILGENILIINPAEALIRELKLFFENNKEIKNKKEKNHKFFFSDVPYNFEKIKNFCFNKKININFEIKNPFNEKII